MITDLQERKIELIQWLSIIDDVALLEKLEDLKEKARDWWDEISESERDSIDQGIADAEVSKLNPHSEARKVYEKWL